MMTRNIAHPLAVALAVFLIAGCVSERPNELAPRNGTHTINLGQAADAASDSAQTPDTVAQRAEADPSFSAEEAASVDSTEDRTDVHWGAIYAKASVPGIHYNINQPAKSADALADDWSLVFAPDAPFRDADTLYFCGDTEKFEVQLLDTATAKLLYDGTLSGVEPCDQ